MINVVTIPSKLIFLKLDLLGIFVKKMKRVENEHFRRSAVNYLYGNY